MATERQKEIKRRRQRKRKIKHLRSRLEQTTDARQRATLIAKIKRVSPHAPVPEE
ncbi:MAG: DUF6800 family protein [Chloroflexota bacterium]|nr:DUF6800 family protein [Chloroflexota bacterium]